MFVPVGSVCASVATPKPRIILEERIIEDSKVAIEIDTTHDRLRIGNRMDLSSHVIQNTLNSTDLLVFLFLSFRIQSMQINSGIGKKENQELS